MAGSSCTFKPVYDSVIAAGHRRSTGLDGSGFSGLPLTGALARTFGTATGASIPVLACLGQISAIFIGGGTVVPWGLIPVAAICNVDPVELARKNMLPVFIGLTCTFLAACLVL